MYLCSAVYRLYTPALYLSPDTRPSSLFLAEKQHAVSPVHFLPASRLSLASLHHPPGTRVDTTLPAAASRRRRRFAPPLVSALRILTDVTLLPARASTACCWSSPASVRFSCYGCCRRPSRTLSESATPSHHDADGRSLSRDTPPFLMMTADSSRSPRLLLLLTVR